ncbi:MAG: hypothetical protein ACTSU3_03005 [Candidatus Thorarchaeota archaeon]
MGEDDSKPEVNEKLYDFPAGIFFVFFPLLCFLLGCLVLSTLPMLLGAYNYLMGAPSQIDLAALAVLGSDLTRLVILISTIIGIMIGSLLSTIVTKKFDIVRREGEAEFGRGLYMVSFAWWTLVVIPVSFVNLLDMLIHGITSRFVTDLGYFLMAGYFLGYAILVMIKYVRLVLYAGSSDARVKMTVIHRGSGRVKLIHKMTLEVVHDGPDP